MTAPTRGVALGAHLARREAAAATVVDVHIEHPELTLPVHELFHTFQGEGPYLGRAATFVRLGGCNLTCTWCDAAHTWDGTEAPTDMPVESITRRIAAADLPITVLTGGEPLLHQQRPAFAALLTNLTALGIAVHVETNGTIPPGPVLDAVDAYTVVSPKLDNAGVDFHKRLKPNALAAFRERAAVGLAAFKFVITHPVEMHEVTGMVRTWNLDPSTVWVMPEATTAADTIAGCQALADEVLAAGYNLGTRLHTILWNNERTR